MSESLRRCPSCGHELLSMTSGDEIASCPNCGRFFERAPAAPTSRWPAPWRLGLALCGPMVLVMLMRAGQWWALKAGQKTLAGVFGEAYPMFLPLAWALWPFAGGFILSRRFAAFPDRWMSTLGLGIAAMVANTAIMLAGLLLQVIF